MHSGIICGSGISFKSAQGAADDTLPIRDSVGYLHQDFRSAFDYIILWTKLCHNPATLVRGSILTGETRCRKQQNLVANLSQYILPWSILVAIRSRGAPGLWTGFRWQIASAHSRVVGVMINQSSFRYHRNDEQSSVWDIPKPRWSRSCACCYPLRFLSRFSPYGSGAAIASALNIEEQRFVFHPPWAA